MAGCVAKTRGYKQTKRRDSHRKQRIELRNEKGVSREMRQRDPRLAAMPSVRDSKASRRDRVRKRKLLQSFLQHLKSKVSICSKLEIRISFNRFSFPG